MFIRSKSRPEGRNLSIDTIRRLLIALYATYPIGCILQLLPVAYGGGEVSSVVGLLLIVAALIIFTVLAGSALQRQTQEPENLLDERERADRNRASFQAHAVFSAIVAAGALYMMLTSDLSEAGKLDLWRPTTGGHWNGVFGGLVLLSSTLPGAILAFGRVPPDAE